MKTFTKNKMFVSDNQDYVSLFILNLSVFLSARLFIFESINPFLASMVGILAFSPMFFSCVAFYFLGILISGGIIYIHKYMIYIVAISAIHLIFKDEKSLSLFKKSALCSLSLLLANLLDIIITGFSAFKFIFCIGEVLMCGAGIIILSSCVDTILNNKIKENLSKTEVTSIAILTAIAVSGASSFGQWSILFSSATVFFFITFIMSFSDNNISKEYGEYIKNAVKNRLKDFSTAFSRLSTAFSDLSQTSATIEYDSKAVVEAISKNVCQGCKNYNYCWSINLYVTYKEIENLFSQYEKSGILSEEYICKELSELCPNKSTLCDSIANYTNLLHTNILWQKKNIESRNLVSRQLKSISGLIEQLSGDIIDSTFPDSTTTNLILNRLKEKGIKNYGVTVLKDKDNKKEIFITLPPCYGMKRCNKKIIPIINECTGAKFVRVCPQCITGYMENKSVCSLHLCEKQRFRISWYATKETKAGSAVSGDNYSLLTMADGRFLVALSDAMGSGNNASMESAATVELFEDFINAGFEKTMAIDMINSALVMKSESDSFATLDSAIINLQNGNTEIIKICAAPTFIKHDSKTEIIKSSSLPVGILPSADTRTTTRRLVHNDVLIMVTDGITDIIEPSSLRDFISNIQTANPKAIASAIIEEAKLKTNSQPADDLTVIAVRFWEKDF